MNDKTKLDEAINSHEFLAFLRGEKKYKIENSQYMPAIEPTDVGTVLTRAIYIKYQEDPSIKNRFEESLFQMLDGNETDIYLVVLYISSQLFKEKNDISPFKMNLGGIISKLQDKLVKNEKALKKDIVFPNGLIKKGVWDHIKRFNEVWRTEYGISLLGK